MITSALAPIAVFVHSRPDSAVRLLKSLVACPEARDSEVFVFSDGPRGDHQEELVERTRAAVIDFRRCFSTMHLVTSPRNLGLANSIIQGVTSVSEDRGSVVVLEDDLVVSRDFLSFMNAGLKAYRSEERVAAIAGHAFPIAAAAPGAYFLPAVTTWGWATWDRAWRNFDAEPDLQALQRQPQLRRMFDQDGNYPYSAMLRAQQKGLVDSWGIRWWWTVFRREQLSLFPRRTLVVNQGFDGQATHTKREVIRQNPLTEEHTPGENAFPDQVEVDVEALAAWRAHIHVRRHRQALQRVKICISRQRNSRQEDP